MAYVVSSGVTSDGVILKNDSMTVLDGGTAQNTTGLINARINVSSGGIISNTTFISAGQIVVSSGGKAINTTTENGADIYVSNGAFVTSTIVNSRSLLRCAGTANNVMVNSGGAVALYSGCVAINIIENGGYVEVQNGAIATFVSNTFSGLVLTGTTANSASIHSGTTAANTTLNNAGILDVFDGGVCSCTTISGGRVYISSGGLANETDIGDEAWGGTGCLYISSGGTANRTTVFNGGSLHIYSGGTANNTTVSNGGRVQIRGGVLAKSIIMAGGSLNVSSGGKATEVVENGGFVNVEAGADVSFESHTFSGLVLLNDASIHSKTIASKTRISAGNLHVFSGGLANETTIYGKGGLIVSSGGIVDSVKTYAGGNLSISSGGSITGKMSFLPGAIFSVEDGAVINFDLARTTAGAKALLSDWSLVQGLPDYTLTVKDNQETGIYKLAGVADEFDGTISVQNTLGESLGTLAVGEKITIDDVNYTLSILEDCLTVTVGNGFVPPAADTEAPTAPVGLMPVVDGQNVALLWNESTDDTGVKEYVVKYSLDGEIFTARTTIPHYVLNDADFGSYSWSVQAVDFAGNESAVSAGNMFTVSNFKTYIVEYSADNFEHVLGLKVNSDALDSFRLPTGTYQSRTRATNSADWTPVEQSIVSLVDKSPMLVKSDEDGNADVFFANPVGTWESGYQAQHVGSINDWNGTSEYAALFGKNKIADIIEGSTDANILLMTDDENGDALFVDDIYTDLPGSIEEQQSRIAQIDEIRAGAGNDIVDMTSQRFEYVGDGLTIRGGEGNDIIWANKGNNKLFGDAGNDRIVGASGNDVIVGGIGNDRMHGGGGDDVFTFCENWGSDNVEQLATGSVTLWFASGSMENWNKTTLTYTDGENSVKVSGVTADQITLMFGDDGSAQFASLANMGAFFDATSERIFEESGKGMLASL